MTDIWNVVTEAFDEKALPGEALGAVTALHAILEETLMNPDRAELLRASETLEGVMRRMLAATPALHEGILGGKDENIQRAYLLGQISMAQGLASRAYSVRPDAGFAERLLSGLSGRIASVLAGDRVDQAALAESLDLPESEFAPTLSGMIQEGSVDFVAHSGRPVYFLTPAALAVSGLAA